MVLELDIERCAKRGEELNIPYKGVEDPTLSIRYKSTKDPTSIG